MEVDYDIQFTVIVYKKKRYISHLAAIALGEQMEFGTTIMFGNRALIGVKDKDTQMIAKYPVYDMDSMIQSFIEPDNAFTKVIVPKKDCFNFDGMTFISLSKMKIKNKYNLRSSLPAIKIFGTYYILCGKQKDVNTRIVVKPE